MKVLWLANIPSPYRVKFFNELGENCELTVLFEKHASSERDDSWKNFQTENFTPVFLKGKSIGVAEAFCPSVVKYLNKSWDHIVVTNAADPTGVLAITYMRAKRIPYEIEGDGAFPGNVSGIKATLKRFLFKGAVRCFSTAKPHDEYYLQYGVDQSKLVRYPFSSIYVKDVLRSPMSEDEQRAYREELGIPEKYVIVSVGRFSYLKGYGKGFDTLVEVCKKLPKEYGVYIIGDEPTDEFVALKEKYSLDNLHFVSFMLGEELKKYYRASDVSVLLTRGEAWGLVINESMANGLPVVTTNRCIAGLEMINESNGVIVEVGSVNKAVEAIQFCVVNRTKMGMCACNMAEKYTIEQMALCHLEIWKSCER